MRTNALDALQSMRKHVGIADVSDEQEAEKHLRRASRYALIYLAESKATEVGIRLRELSDDRNAHYDYDPDDEASQP